MISIIFLTVMSLIMNGETEIFNFNSQSTSGEWTTVNDVVMGGISESRFENEFNDFEGAIIRVKGDGNIYSLRFRTDKNFDGISYQAKFETDPGEWKEYKIPFSEFKPTFRGTTLSNKPRLESKDIKQIGILISDKQFGKFELNIEWVSFY